jgi:hypothetical protein
MARQRQSAKVFAFKKVIFSHTAETIKTQMQMIVFEL